MPSLKKPEQKLVLDVNVWVSALLWGGKPAQVVELAQEGQLDIFVSESIIAELSQVLLYPKIVKVYKDDGLLARDLIEAVLKVVKFAEVKQTVKVVLEHPADDKFIDCALAAGAAYVISGDKHLLKLGSYKKIRVLSVNDFLEVFVAK